MDSPSACQCLSQSDQSGQSVRSWWAVCWTAGGWRRAEGRRRRRQTNASLVWFCSGVCCCCWSPVALISFVSAEAHSRKRWLFYTQVWAVGMPGILLAFLTPDSDKRKCRKLPLLKPCLLDIGHPCDTAASIGYFVSETWNIVVTELREEEPRQSCGVTAGRKRAGVGDQPSTGKKMLAWRLCSWANHQREHWDTLWLFKVASLSIIQCMEHTQRSKMLLVSGTMCEDDKNYQTTPELCTETSSKIQNAKKSRDFFFWVCISVCIMFPNIDRISRSIPRSKTTRLIKDKLTVDFNWIH